MIQLQSNRVGSPDDLDQLIEVWKADNGQIQSANFGSTLMTYDSVGKIKVSAMFLDTGLVDVKEWY